MARGIRVSRTHLRPRRDGHLVRAIKTAGASFILAFVFSAQLAEPAQAQEYGIFGKPGHWCMFNRACDWSSHATIAFGTTYLLQKVDVPLHYAAGAGAAIFVGKEIRDHVKWGDFWTFDSLMDLAAGVAGAGLAYWVFQPDDRAMPRPYVDWEGQIGLELDLPLF